MPERNWRRAREEGERAMAEDAKRMRKELGLSTTDREIEKLAKERAEKATRKAMRDKGEG